MEFSKTDLTSSPQAHHYQIGDHVLVHWRDGMYYLGKVRKVETMNISFFSDTMTQFKAKASTINYCRVAITIMIVLLHKVKDSLILLSAGR